MCTVYVKDAYHVYNWDHMGIILMVVCVTFIKTTMKYIHIIIQNMLTVRKTR